MDPALDSPGAKLFSHLYEENLTNLTHYLHYNKIFNCLTKVLQPISLQEIILRLKNNIKVVITFRISSTAPSPRSSRSTRT